jgi:hypothetical protein
VVVAREPPRRISSSTTTHRIRIFVVDSVLHSSSVRTRLHTTTPQSAKPRSQKSGKRRVERKYISSRHVYMQVLHHATTFPVVKSCHLSEINLVKVERAKLSSGDWGATAGNNTNHFISRSSVEDVEVETI